LNLIDMKVYEILEKAALGNGLPDEDIEVLYGVNPTSREAAAIRQLGQELSMKAANGKAEVHAQIGLNATPCQYNCKFCSFAACAKLRKGKVESPKEEVLEYAKAYVEQGANAIVCLCTGSYEFEKLIDMMGSVREIIPADMPLLVNTDDFSLEQAHQLYATGVNGIYHAARMREGIDTGIPLQTRLNTFKNATEAGLTISTCVEPVGPEHSPAEITKHTRICIDINPVSAGIARRLNVPGTALVQHGQLLETSFALLVAVYRLAAGTSLRLNCAVATPFTAASGANLAWAEVGSNPRDTKAKTEKGGKGVTVPFLQRIMREGGWEVLEGPSFGWMR
jgi:biotin synthase